MILDLPPINTLTPDTMRTDFFSSYFLLPALIRSAIAANTTVSSSTACNNSPSLCNRQYNNITHLGAHDSPFLTDTATDYSTSGNQYYNSTIQLDAGVRLLTAQVHSTNASSSAGWHLCHTSCDLLDAGPLSDWLTEIKAWLDTHTSDVVTVLLVNSDGATASELGAQYEAADITDYAYVPTSKTSTSDWPTLESLVNNGTRLLNFVASLTENTGADYLMNEFTYIFENNYEVTSPSNFSCEANRPSSVNGETSQALAANMMPLMNHFLDTDEAFGIETPNSTYTSTTNAPSGGTGNLGNLGNSATTCANDYGRAPTFILVDYFNVGPAIETVDRLNGVTNPVGRTNVSTAAATATTSGANYHASISLTVSVMAMIVGMACVS